MCCRHGWTAATLLALVCMLVFPASAEKLVACSGGAARAETLDNDGFESNAVRFTDCVFSSFTFAASNLALSGKTVTFSGTTALLGGLPLTVVADGFMLVFEGEWSIGKADGTGGAALDVSESAIGMNLQLRGHGRIFIPTAAPDTFRFREASDNVRIDGDGLSDMVIAGNAVKATAVSAFQFDRATSGLDVTLRSTTFLVPGTTGDVFFGDFVSGGTGRFHAVNLSVQAVSSGGGVNMMGCRSETDACSFQWTIEHSTISIAADQAALIMSNACKLNMQLMNPATIIRHSKVYASSRVPPNIQVMSWKTGTRGLRAVLQDSELTLVQTQQPLDKAWSGIHAAAMWFQRDGMKHDDLVIDIQRVNFTAGPYIKACLATLVDKLSFTDVTVIIRDVNFNATAVTNGYATLMSFITAQDPDVTVFGMWKNASFLLEDVVTHQLGDAAHLLMIWGCENCTAIVRRLTANISCKAGSSLSFNGKGRDTRMVIHDSMVRTNTAFAYAVPSTGLEAEDSHIEVDNCTFVMACNMFGGVLLNNGTTKNTSMVMRNSNVTYRSTAIGQPEISVAGVGVVVQSIAATRISIINSTVDMAVRDSSQALFLGAIRQGADTETAPPMTDLTLECIDSRVSFVAHNVSNTVAVLFTTDVGTERATLRALRSTVDISVFTTVIRVAVFAVIEGATDVTCDLIDSNVSLAMEPFIPSDNVVVLMMNGRATGIDFVIKRSSISVVRQITGFPASVPLATVFTDATMGRQVGRATAVGAFAGDCTNVHVIFEDSSATLDSTIVMAFGHFGVGVKTAQISNLRFDIVNSVVTASMALFGSIILADTDGFTFVLTRSTVRLQFDKNLLDGGSLRGYGFSKLTRTNFTVINSDVHVTSSGAATVGGMLSLATLGAGTLNSNTLRIDGSNVTIVAGPAAAVVIAAVSSEQSEYTVESSRIDITTSSIGAGFMSMTSSGAGVVVAVTDTSVNIAAPSATACSALDFNAGTAGATVPSGTMRVQGLRLNVTAAGVSALQLRATGTSTVAIADLAASINVAAGAAPAQTKATVISLSGSTGSSSAVSQSTVLISAASNFAQLVTLSVVSRDVVVSASRFAVSAAAGATGPQVTLGALAFPSVWGTARFTDNTFEAAVDASNAASCLAIFQKPTTPMVAGSGITVADNTFTGCVNVGTEWNAVEAPPMTIRCNRRDGRSRGWLVPAFGEDAVFECLSPTATGTSRSASPSSTLSLPPTRSRSSTRTANLAAFPTPSATHAQTPSASATATASYPLVGIGAVPLFQPARRGPNGLAEAGPATWAAESPLTPHFALENLRGEADGTRSLALSLVGPSALLGSFAPVAAESAAQVGAGAGCRVWGTRPDDDTIHEALRQYATRTILTLTPRSLRRNATELIVTLPRAAAPRDIPDQDVTTDLNVTVHVSSGCLLDVRPPAASTARFVVLHPPPPAKAVVSKSADTVGTAAAVTSSAAGSPGSGLAVARVNFVASVTGCEPTLGQPLPLSASPLQLVISAEPVGYALGAAIGNSILIVVFCALAFAAAIAKRMRKGWTTQTVADMLTFARLPSIALFPALLVLQPTFGNGLTVVVHGESIGVRFGGLVVAGGIAAAYFAVGWRLFFKSFDAKFVAVDADLAEEAMPRSAVGRVANKVLSSIGEWADTKRDGFVRRYFFFFADFSDRAPWFLFADTGLSLLLAFAQALQTAGSKESCQVLGWVGAAGMALLLAVMLVMRPHESLFNLIFSAFVLGGQVLGAFMALSDQYTNSPGVAEAVEGLLNALLFLLTLRSAYDISRMVWGVVRRRMLRDATAKRERTAAEQRLLMDGGHFDALNIGSADAWDEDYPAPLWPPAAAAADGGSAGTAVGRFVLAGQGGGAAASGPSSKLSPARQARMEAKLQKAATERARIDTAQRAAETRQTARIETKRQAEARAADHVAKFETVKRSSEHMKAYAAQLKQCAEEVRRSLRALPPPANDDGGRGADASLSADSNARWSGGRAGDDDEVPESVAALGITAPRTPQVPKKQPDAAPVAYPQRGGGVAAVTPHQPASAAATAAPTGRPKRDATSKSADLDRIQRLYGDI